MVQIFAYFEHIQIVQKIEPTKLFPEMTRQPNFPLTGTFRLFHCSKCPCTYGRRVLLPRWRKKHAPWVEKLQLTQRVSHVLQATPLNIPGIEGCGLKDMENLKIRTSKFYWNGKFELQYTKYVPTKISRYMVVKTP